MDRLPGKIVDYTERHKQILRVSRYPEIAEAIGKDYAELTQTVVETKVGKAVRKDGKQSFYFRIQLFTAQYERFQIRKDAEAFNDLLKKSISNLRKDTKVKEVYGELPFLEVLNYVIDNGSPLTNIDKALFEIRGEILSTNLSIL